jgi:hypothetical protein
LLVAVSLWLAGWYFPITERSVRIAALILQIIGFVLVFRGIDATLGNFGQTRLLSTLWGWLLEWWRGRPFLVRHLVISGQMASFDTDFMRAKATVGAGPNATMKQRLAILEQKVKSLDGEVSQLQDDLEKTKRELGERIDSATDALRKEAEDMANKLRAKFVDGIGSELLGVAFFVLGTVLSSLPEEISNYLS